VRSFLPQPFGGHGHGGVGDLFGRQILLPQAVAHAEEDTDADQGPGARFVGAVDDLAAGAGGGEAARVALRKGEIMFAVDIVGDELGFLDDAVEFGMLADEGDVGGEADALGGEATWART
jgi:hypothetical protein